MTKTLKILATVMLILSSIVTMVVWYAIVTWHSWLPNDGSFETTFMFYFILIPLGIGCPIIVYTMYDFLKRKPETEDTEEIAE